MLFYQELKTFNGVVLKNAFDGIRGWRARIVTAGKPAQPIKKGLPGPGLLAHLITEKYADHIPLNCQEHRLARQGVELSRSSLYDWTASAARTLEPLYKLMKTLILLCGTIHTDDTQVKVRDSERKIKVLARLSIYFGDQLHPYNVFDFTMTRNATGRADFCRALRVTCRPMPSAVTTGSSLAAMSWRWVAMRRRAAEVHGDADDGCGSIGGGPGPLSTALRD